MVDLPVPLDDRSAAHFDARDVSDGVEGSGSALEGDAELAGPGLVADLAGLPGDRLRSSAAPGERVRVGRQRSSSSAAVRVMSAHSAQRGKCSVAKGTGPAPGSEAHGWTYVCVVRHGHGGD